MNGWSGYSRGWDPKNGRAWPRLGAAMPIFLGGTTQCNADLESGQRCVPDDCYRLVVVGLEGFV